MTCVPPRGPADSLVGARDCPEHPAPRPELPLVSAMRWTPDFPVYRPSDFDTPPYVPRRVVA
ncbi:MULTISPECIES: hypothetical protein [Prauserella salsuginis group]|uniref:Uncharacterized protein n=2 Tax=Prauserella salsuginis group TaxID=2893672 RepID=A0A839XUG2_9PSEU|nr:MULTISPECIES: hypothetical protein [Prauserella salsuginis group]MBB3666377.1 hypothetical protein [Prauserella sediminis]MCR3719166.1 hypothetical protein [Prauserella flava]MCR3735821.1 hypothetical protein [Prauserella salsuginis]